MTLFKFDNSSFEKLELFNLLRRFINLISLTYISCQVKIEEA